MLAVALCCPSFLLQLRCSGPVQLCLSSVWPRSHWSAAVTGCPHLAQVCVSPVASRASHALRRWRCAASYPLAVELPRCRSYVCVDGAEACALFDELWAVVPGASAETHVALPPSMAVMSGMSGVRLPRRSPSWPPPIHGLPTQRVSPPWSTSFGATAPRVASGSMPDRDDYSECSWT